MIWATARIGPCKQGMWLKGEWVMLRNIGRATVALGKLNLLVTGGSYQ